MNETSHTPTNPFSFRKGSHAEAVDRGETGRRPSPRRVWIGIALVMALAVPALAIGPLRGSDDSSASAATHSEMQDEIRRLYLAFFLREPDATGGPFWFNLRSQGKSLSWVADRFAESEEFRLRYGRISNDDFVRLLYRNVLDRAPDPTGWGHWRSLLANGMSRGQVTLGFSESIEFRQRVRRMSPTPPPAPTPSPTTPPTAPPSGNPPPSTGVPGGIPVNEAAIPAANPGWGNSRINNASYSPIRRPSDPTGAFRVNCQISHWNFDDPIVFPSVRRATHLHAFYGNTAVDGMSTSTSVRTRGNSTCTGGISNRTAYWAPAIIDTRTGNPVHPGTDAEARDHALQVYYKAGYDGVLSHTIQNFPDGLRMIAGTASSTRAQPTNIVSYHCADGPNGGAVQSTFPNCRPGQIFVMTVAFPQCWDGRNLDSPDHKSHMAYGAGWPDRGCPASHPVPLPQVTQNFRYRVPPSGMSTWRLASDMYNGPAGYSGHADWINGWDRNVFQRVIDNCIRPGLDCQMNLLGDGRQLY